MYAIFTMRKLMLTNRVNNLNAKLMEISQKTQDLANYAANISDGVITPEEAANSSASLFQRQSNYMSTTFNNSMAQANQATQAYTAQYNALNQQSNGSLANTIDPSGTTSSLNTSALYQSYLKQAMQAAGNSEQKKIEAIEKELDQQRLKLETQLNAAQAELTKVEEAETKAIEKSAPKYSG
ncbi:MAG: hypothetical protein PHV37_05895 [Candidatus Gastranaerophilales bacterium]|nr:hypothetical protein [Candidatus Gastranaerophilales bacterium]